MADDRRIIAAAVAAAKAGRRPPPPKRPGTVTSTTGHVRVLLDGDADPVPVAVASGNPGTDDRVLVEFRPGGAAYITDVL